MKSSLPTAVQIWKEPIRVELPPGLLDLGLPELVLRLLYRQGVQTSRQARAFMDYRAYSPASPYDLPGMQEGVERVYKAINNGEKIGVWGDFDVDGQTSTTVLMAALRSLNADCTYHIPLRDPEGHGIKLEALKKFTQQGLSLLLTCDTGISEVASIAWAQENGLDVVVTDHHTLPDVLPKAYAIINPHLVEESHPLRPLPGVGVACKFAEALLERFGRSEFANTLHDLAALGIIADVAELRADARFLAQSGIECIRKGTRPAIQAMLEAAEMDASQFNEEGIGFSLAPRMNAIGRLDNANPMVEFLLSEDPSFLAVTVNRLEGLNAKRKMRCDDVFKGALVQIERNPSLLDHPVLILSHPEWHPGVVGIVASRLVELFNRPVILLVGSQEDKLRGSARSIEGVNITAAIRQQSKLLNSFGGHPMAAGLSLDGQNFNAFHRRLDLYVEKESEALPLVKELRIDAWQQPGSIDLTMLQELDRLSPFGAGNPPPVFAARDLTLRVATPVGKTREHLQVLVEDAQGQQSKFIWWQGAGFPQPEGIFDLAFTARSSTYKGKPQVQLEWLDFRSSETKIELVTKKNFVKENIDCRFSADPQLQLEQIIEKYRPEVFSEGSVTGAKIGKPRNELSPAENLVIWTVPPSQKVLDEVIHRVHPARIFWFGLLPPENELDSLLNSTALQLKSHLASQIPTLDLESLSSRLAVTPELAEIALRWFESRGNIRLILGESGSFSIEPGKGSNPQLEKELRENLKKSLAEIQAFRRYYLKADLPHLAEQS